MLLILHVWPNLYFLCLSDVSDEVECSSTPKRCRFSLQNQQVDEDEEDEEGEDHSVRRSSRITRLDSRKQSVLYDRLITK